MAFPPTYISIVPKSETGAADVTHAQRCLCGAPNCSGEIGSGTGATKTHQNSLRSSSRFFHSRKTRSLSFISLSLSLSSRRREWDEAGGKPKEGEELELAAAAAARAAGERAAQPTAS